MRPRVVAFLLAVLVASRVFAPVVRAQQKPAAPTFRTGVALVPVDVRVIDNKTGRPITDLKQDDFTILEDNVRQEVRHFILQTLDAEAPPPTAVAAPAAPALDARPALRQTPLSLAPQTSRIFLIVLGRGRLQEPSKGLDALIHFVREQLLPRDRVAVFAYNRATDFTTDHEQIAQVLERFKLQNDQISSDITNALAGLAGVYGSRELPQSTQARLESVFRGPSPLPVTNTGRAENAQTGDRTALEMRRQVNGSIDATVAAIGGAPGGQQAPAGRPAPAGGEPPTGRTVPNVPVSISANMTPLNAAENVPYVIEPPINQTLGAVWAPFDAFVTENVQTLHEVANLYAAIAYMNALEGEKRLIFVTESGMPMLPRAEDMKDIAATAAEARVAIDVIQTGGIVGVQNAAAMREMAADTGGSASIADYSQPALDRLDAITRSGYLLGYYPSNTTWNGAWRKVVVKVKRPGVTVMFRHAYRAISTIPAFDRRAYTTRFRIDAAMRHDTDVTDIGVKLNASLATVDGQPEVRVDARIDPSRLHFDIRNGIHFGTIDIAVVAMDENRGVLGGAYKKQAAHLEYDDGAMALANELWIPYQVRMRVPPNTRYVRLVVYDYLADLVGTAGRSVF